MTIEPGKSKMNAWITFIGVVLLLIGIYASVKTVVNLTLFEKYPQTGVLSINFFGAPTYYQREQDCLYPQTYYTPDGQKTRQPNEEEKTREKNQQKICVEGVKEQRQTAKINDISQSLLFLFLGAGVLAARKIFF
ncbi:MAG: hypothetical protein HYW86_04845 [Candidatus Roizmanbacteria bacterium]|nr:MAG: hypothetical protein HYW86_04845 [Candidatus Roizmanbacteria bacterium]